MLVYTTFAILVLIILILVTYILKSKIGCYCKHNVEVKPPTVTYTYPNHQTSENSSHNEHYDRAQISENPSHNEHYEQAITDLGNTQRQLPPFLRRAAEAAREGRQG
ncbi:unnamed protein product, partial [Meganyctiphanes norvegica]